MDERNGESVRVFCRLCPCEANEAVCMHVASPTMLAVTLPKHSISYRTGNVRAIHYTFRKIFDSASTQKEVFDEVARPLVQDLIKCKNGVLFAYGITNSGKTYTMTGKNTNGGIIHRSIGLLFNTIKEQMIPKATYKPDGLNGYDTQTDIDSVREDVIDYIKSKKSSTPDIEEMLLKSDDFIDGVDLQNKNFTVFVTFVEIYNNRVYDLLETDEEKYSQVKIIREGSFQNMYVHGVTEVEVRSISEALNVLNFGQRRKKTAQTRLNFESSRSHTVFNIRVLQKIFLPNGLKKCSKINQLSLVDLAGSERLNRTNNKGSRLKEAANINNSLLTLRLCLEILLENQTTGKNRIVPYRDTKLTYLFKSYFEGHGQVNVIVCINPKTENLDESLHVLKFAEMTQEIEISRPVSANDNGKKGQKCHLKVREIGNGEIVSVKSESSKIGDKMSNAGEIIMATENNRLNLKTIDYTLVYNLNISMPGVVLNEPRNETTIKNIVNYLERRNRKKKELLDDFVVRQNNFRQMLVAIDDENKCNEAENKTLKAILEQERLKITSLENKVFHLQNDKDALVLQLEANNRELEEQLNIIVEKDHTINRLRAEMGKQKYKLEKKINEQSEQMGNELETKLQQIRNRYETKIKEKDKRFCLAKKILLSEDCVSTCSINSVNNMRLVEADDRHSELKEKNIDNLHQTDFDKENEKTDRVLLYRPRFRTTAKRRRSQSTGRNERWLEHRAAMPAPLVTVMQPKIKKTKTITKLTDSKDVANKSISKYCLISQEKDTDGEIETKVYKADVLKTRGGGAQIIFNGIERLKQESPTDERS